MEPDAARGISYETVRDEIKVQLRLWRKQYYHSLGHKWWAVVVGKAQNIETNRIILELDNVGVNIDKMQPAERIL